MLINHNAEIQRWWQIIKIAKDAQKFLCGNSKAVFGDCGPVSTDIVNNLADAGIKAKLTHGNFIVDISQPTEITPHTWVTVGGHILDATVDQFFSILDIDLECEIPGIYFVPFDGEYLVNRYQLSCSYFLVKNERSKAWDQVLEA